jgi:NAD(P)-dependent dehydrogenase (short-subunit alcohol dehydrogenase family)
MTGTARGFGRIWAEAALERGDRVAATARNIDDIAALKVRFGDAVLPLTLDVTNADQVRATMQQAHAHFGRLDIVLNNAGYSLVGTVEEAREADVRALFDTNYFGQLHVIQAALPLLRAQGHGHLIGVSSTLGTYAVPLIGFYCTTKWAVEAMHESLAAEVRPFGIHVTLLEPGAYKTEFGSLQSLKMSPALDTYADLRARVFEGLQTMQQGDPYATPRALFALVDAETPPLRFALGNAMLPRVRAEYASRIAEWEAWETVSSAAQGPATTT